MLDSFICRLGELGATCLYSRVDVDLEDWPVINKWMVGVLDKVTKLELTTDVDYLDLSNQTEDTGYSRTKPFTSVMAVSTTCELDLCVRLYIVQFFY